jgi:DNA polymerase-3 subunit delta
MAKTAQTSQKPKSIYVIAGKDNALVSAQCEKLLNSLLAPAQRATGLFSPDPAQVHASDVLDELRTLPFLSERRVVLIKGADKFISENRRLLENYFDNPSPTGTLVLTVNTWDTRTRLSKKLPKVGKLLSITQPKPWLLANRLREYTIDAHDKKLERAAADLLIELTGDQLGPLHVEIDKLAIFAAFEKTITAAHVEALIGKNRLFNAFGVIDACLAKNVADAVDRLRNMFEADKTTEYSVIGAFAYHFRRMFAAKVLLEKDTPSGEIAKSLGIRGNKAAFFAQLRKTSLQQIGSTIHQLAEIDYAIKTGRANPRVAVEKLVIKLAAAPNPA